MVPISHCVCDEYVAIIKRNNVLVLPQMNTCFPGANIRSVVPAPGSHTAEHRPRPTVSVYVDQRCSFSPELRKSLDTLAPMVNSMRPVPPAIDVHYNAISSGENGRSIGTLMRDIDSALSEVSSLRSVRINVNPDELHRLGMPAMLDTTTESVVKWMRRVMPGVVAASFRSTGRRNAYMLIVTYRLMRQEIPTKYVDCTVRLEVQLCSDKCLFQEDILFTSYSRMNPTTALSELHLEINDANRDWLSASCVFLESKKCTVKRLHVFLCSGINLEPSQQHYDHRREKSSLDALIDSLSVNTSVTCISGFPLLEEFNFVALARLLRRNKTITSLEGIEFSPLDAKFVKHVVSALRFENNTVTSVSFRESTLDKPLFRQVTVLKMLAQRNATAAYLNHTEVKMEQ